MSGVCLSVRPCVCTSGSHTFLVVGSYGSRRHMHSSECCHYVVVILTYSISYSTSLLIQDNHNAVCMIICPEDYEEVGDIEGKQCEFLGVSVQDRTNRDRLAVTYRCQLENTA